MYLDNSKIYKLKTAEKKCVIGKFGDLGLDY